MEGKELGISVAENVKAAEAFGPAAAQALERQLRGIGGTLHVTKEEDIIKVGSLAWQLSQQTKMPVVIVVRAAQ